MNEDDSQLRDKIKKLEQELASKSLETQLYRKQLAQANAQIEKLIFQVSEEIKFASAIQKLISPTEIPNISGFEISTKYLAGSRSGGDYFDIFEHEDKLKFGILLASCSGYTMSALLLSILMKLSGQVEAKRGLAPEEFLKILSQEMRQQMSDKDKANVFYACIDKRDFSFTYSGLGNIKVLHQIFGRESLIEIQGDPGPIMSKQCSAPIASKIKLNSKDRLVMVSDGVLRTENKDGEEWGMKGLQDAIRSAPKTGVHELRNEIIFRIQQFSGSKEPVRDLTVIVLETKENVLKLI